MHGHIHAQQSAVQLFNNPIVTRSWIFTALTTSSARKKGGFYSVVGLGSFVTLWSVSAHMVNGILAGFNNWRRTIRHRVQSWPFPSHGLKITSNSIRRNLMFNISASPSPLLFLNSALCSEYYAEMLKEKHRGDQIISSGYFTLFLFTTNR